MAENTSEEALDLSHDTIEPASSGRAKCRGCGQTIGKGELRFGERVPNPFGEGEATYWFHVECAAYRRPERFVRLENLLRELENATDLEMVAKAGVEHYRLCRIKRAEVAPSGRAKCRQCHEAISKGSWRVALEIWEEGRFNPMGFIHMACSGDYFGTSNILDRLKRATPELQESQVGEIESLLGV